MVNTVSVTTSDYNTATRNGQINTFAVGSDGSLAGNGNYLVWQQNYQGRNPTITPNATSITYTFSRPVNNLKITLTDIDRDTDNADFIDRLTFNGYATATGGTAITLTGTNVATGNTNKFVGSNSNATGTSDPVSANNAVTGTAISITNRASDVTVTFPSAVTRLVLTYENLAPFAAGTDRTQTVGIASLSWCRQTPVANTITNATLASGQAATAITSLSTTSTEGTVKSYTISALPPPRKVFTT